MKSVHGVRVAVDCDDPGTRDALARDLAGFGEAAAGEADITLRLERRAGAPARGPWRWRGARWSDRGGERLLDYGGGAGASWDFARERGTVWAPEPDLLHELGYLFLHSRVGAALDRRGLHRVHALGFSWRGKGGLLLLPSGGGKTTLALALAARPEFALLSDDLPLLGADGRLRAFPQRLSLRGPGPFPFASSVLRPFRRRRHGAKTLLDLSAYPGRLADAAPLEWLVVGCPGPGPTFAARCSRARAAAALLDGMVLGRGLPQVLELMAPPPPYRRGAAALARLAWSRWGAARAALARARPLLLRLGARPGDAARALADALSS
ncbi:MAG: hypothetical protein HYZ75_07950 [Elusimicrobia bacterium]|nr:hypothetical protein [Elusimicrobiota bacterium]